MAQTLRTLSGIITTAVENIERRCDEIHLQFPSLHQPFSESTEAARLDPAVLQNVHTLVSAAAQLIAVAKVPQTYIFNATCAYYLSSTMRIATETHVPEILRDAGLKGMHVNEIGAKNGIDPSKLARILRYLAVHHIFTESSPDVFAINRHSSVLDTGKQLNDILADPLSKHDNTSGVAALVGHCTDEDFKGSAYMLEHLTDPETSAADEPSRTPMMRAFNYNGTFWSWLEGPDNVLRLKRFGAAMKGVSSVQAPEAILKGFDWSSLPPEGLVVDVGGGLGVSSLALAEKFSGLRFVIQDRAAVIKEAKEHWQKAHPEIIHENRINFQEHDFFESQPVKNASVFLLKQICHDWPDKYAAKILQHLRDAAMSSTVLVLIDCIVPYACEVQDEALTPAGLTFSRRPPLLPDNVDADPSIYYTDLSMYVHFCAQERTIDQIISLLKATGWEIDRVYASDGQVHYYPQIVARPSFSG